MVNSSLTARLRAATATVMAGVSLLFSLGGCSKGDDPAANTTDETDASAPATPVENSPLIGRAPGADDDSALESRNEPDENEWTKRFAAASETEQIEIIAEKESQGPEQLAPLIMKALKSPSLEVRVEAVRAGGVLEGRGAVDVLSAALLDDSEEVRAYAFDAILQVSDEAVHIEFFKEALKNPFESVKGEALTELSNTITKEAFEATLEGLKDPDPVFRAEVMEVIRPITEQQTDATFDSYDAARSWWRANSGQYDDALSYIGE